MCNSYDQDTHTLVVPPEEVIAAVRDAQNVYLRDCPCRRDAGNCEQEDTRVCLLFDDAPETDVREPKGSVLAFAVDEVADHIIGAEGPGALVAGESRLRKPFHRVRGVRSRISLAWAI
jgi:hypothetical protein